MICSTQKYDFLIVGAGLYGATFAYFAQKAGYRCLVIDKRPHLGGNVYCESIDGINVHKYGAHIFHTSDKELWDFVNSLVPFNRYTNCPVANYKGELYNLPFNMNTFHQMWNISTPAEAEAVIESQRAVAREKYPEPGNLEEQALCLVGSDIYEKLIKGYTEKQWGRPCTDLPAFIIRRLPVRMVFDNNYFNDLYQGIPIGGYNSLIDALIDGVDIQVGVDFFSSDYRANWRKYADNLVYTGRIDEFYDFRFGHLQFRTVAFEHEVMDMPNYQGNAVVNYTDKDVAYTRIIEHKHFESFGHSVYDNPKTVISREYPSEWTEGKEPYYPINDAANNECYSKYLSAASLERNVLFGGRLAEYKYYDMAPVMKKAITDFNSMKIK